MTRLITYMCGAGHSTTRFFDTDVGPVPNNIGECNARTRRGLRAPIEPGQSQRGKKTRETISALRCGKILILTDWNSHG